MKYAIQTLEIEIARIRQALRIARTTTSSYEDAQGGYSVDYIEQEGNIFELEKAIEILKQS